jgi:hypothetical protein
VTGVSVATLLAVNAKVVKVEPCGIETVETRLTSPGNELRLIVAPALPAEEVRATVQVDTLGGAIDIGLQENPFNSGVGTIVTVAPLAVAGIDAADGFAAAGLKIWTGDDVFDVEEETFIETVATTPLGIVPVLSPHRMHLKLPTWLWQETDLLA